MSKLTSRTLRTAPAVVVCAAALLLSGTGGAFAAHLITGKQIKDGTITSVDVRNGTLGVLDTSAALDAYEQRVGAFTTVAGVDSDVAAGANGAVQLTCPADTAVLGGFAWWTHGTQGAQVEYVGRQQAQAFSPNTGSGADTFHLTLTCGNVTS